MVTLEDLIHETFASSGKIFLNEKDHNLTFESPYGRLALENWPSAASTDLIITDKNYYVSENMTQLTHLRIAVLCPKSEAPERFECHFAFEPQQQHFSIPPLEECEIGALFLDRDDVIIKNIPYNGDPAQVELIPATTALIAKANARSIPVIVVSNQSGIGRGFLTERQLFAVNGQMKKLLAKKGAYVDECWHSSFFLNSEDSRGRRGSHLRKPASGMLLRAAQKNSIQLKNSLLIGDRASDIEAASHAGVGAAVLFGDRGKISAEQSRLKFKPDSFQTCEAQQNLEEIARTAAPNLF